MPDDTKILNDQNDEHTIVVVGSGGVGKSCLTVRFLKDEFTSEYDPTVEENYRKKVTIENIPSVVNIIDTAGQQEFTALRDQHLMSGEAFLIVFAINDKTSFDECFELIDSVITLKDTNDVPFVLVGNKCVIIWCDVKKDMENLREVTKEMVETKTRESKIPYIETSAKDNINVNQAFEDLIKETRRIKRLISDKEKMTKPKVYSCCTIL
ncbi:Small GTPase superfamily domain-containing protein [Rozella allomycis CSF55]|uniref:Small GTPase superfamily domain-containing protein n=1 Tax=Rozella allomycis (strain CSF55) TaxID=988480 RepID=A0A075AVD0_ROZAC|nr:Small GTPase superfamily domain-containing protein [Rozella allomycis CSF55]|eukprot:EPZ34286.1 Small GTPase superfamily domain-containing protein [Rozella allomycis CSF55]